MKIRIGPETRVRTSGADGTILSEVVLGRDEDVGVDSVDGVAEVINIHLHGDIHAELRKLLDIERDRRDRRERERVEDRKAGRERDRVLVVSPDRLENPRDTEEKRAEEHTRAYHDGATAGAGKHAPVAREYADGRGESYVPVPRDVISESAIGGGEFELRLPTMREGIVYRTPSIPVPRVTPMLSSPPTHTIFTPPVIVRPRQSR